MVIVKGGIFMPTFMDYILLAIAIINIGLLIYLLLNNKRARTLLIMKKSTIL